MSRERMLRSASLVVHTRALLEAVRSGKSTEDVDQLVERQREAFNEFARCCDASQPLDPSSRENIDIVLTLGQDINQAIEQQSVELIARGRKISQSLSQARAFRSSRPEPPRFVTRRV